MIFGCYLTVLLVSGGLAGQAAEKPSLARMKPSDEATAYKKEIKRDPSNWQWNIPIELPHVTHGVVHSQSMDRDVGYNIYLPPSYAVNTATRYPVVYYLHGATGSETSDTPVVEYVISEIASRRIGEVVYVFVNAGHYSGYRDNPENHVMAETYLIEELIPEIDRRYRTIASRRGRALMGFSMGGGGATRLALKHPEMFCALASFAGAMDQNPEEAESSTNGGSMRLDSTNNVYRWASANREKISSDLGLFFFVGSEDRLYVRNAAFVEYLHEQKIGFNYRVMDGLGHDLWGSMALCGAEAIRYLASQYEEAGAVQKRGE